MTVKQPPVTLEFSSKYDRAHAEAYYEKHRSSLGRRLSHWREVRIARKALAAADHPELVLDMPCGAGRFWPLLAERPNRVILAADRSADMIAVALERHPELAPRVHTLQTDAFAVDLPDAAVDAIICMRLLHHIGEPEHRALLLRELHRVTRDSLIISLWVDGSFQAWRRSVHHRRKEREGRTSPQNRFVLPRRQAEAELEQPGFRIQRRLDLAPRLAMLRTYVLRKH